MFQIVASEQPVKLTDPKAIRALAHPARLAVIEELYSGRELTATECAQIAGLSPSAMSYHLRNLHRWGIVEPADSQGDGRERPWRAAGSYLQLTTDSVLAESALLTQTVVGRLADQLGEWLANKATQDQAWLDASVVGSGQVWLTVDELIAVRTAVGAAIDRFRTRSPDDLPDGARRVRFAVFAFPSDSGQ